MTSKETLLTGLRVWFDEHAETLALRGLSASLDTSRAGWDKASLVLVVDGNDFLGQLIVWDSGEAELECAEVATGQIRQEHRDLRSLDDLHEVLAVLQDWLHAGETGSGG